MGYSPWGREELDTTERLHFHFSLSCTGEENGNPLQCSCLKNPRDGGAWWAAVYGVAQSWTRLKRLSSSSSSSKAFQKWDRVCRLGGAGAREKPPWGSRGQCVHQLQAHILLFSRSVVSNSSRPHGLQPTRLLHPWDFPGKSTGVGCHCLLLYILLGLNKCINDMYSSL